ncbi:regulator of chromosome condensation (RCC1) [Achlya hypogyna]|uniref:Regulator of chromosome condensation (RCC1) n=1 Tax=Achlya hypogyna TaxID=1202772 RepID=A0A1V9ZB48_ACHHY|nr:regulator of chromosome condensation (RCC1) [Achlya hypogyna]
MAPEVVAKKSLFRNKAAPPPSNVIVVDGIPLSRDLVEDPSLSDAPVQVENTFLDAEQASMFRKYDTDRSGGIDEDEFKVLLADLQIEIPPPKVHVYFKKCDVGQKGYITFEEFRLALFTCDPTNPARTGGFCPSKVLNPKDLFAIFDADDSGEIGRDEFTEILKFLKIKMAFDRQEAVFSQFEDPTTESLTYPAFRSLWLTLVDVRKELSNRNIDYNKLLPRSKLAQKLAAVLDKEDAQEQYTMLEAEWNFEWERTKARRETLLANAKRYADYILATTLDVAGQVYAFGKGSFGRFDGPPADKDFVDCPYFSRLFDLWTDRVRGADRWAPLVETEPEHKSNGWDSPKKLPPPMKRTRVAKDTTETQQLAFQNRTVATNTAWLWARRVKQVSCGASVAYALTDAGELYCWGGTTRSWDYIYSPDHTIHTAGWNGQHAEVNAIEIGMDNPSGSRPFTARTEQLKLTAPHQMAAEAEAHADNYVRKMFNESVPPEPPVESTAAEFQRLKVLLEYLDLHSPVGEDLDLPQAREIIEFDLRADLVTNALRLRALQSSQNGKFANCTKLSKILVLELECMGEPFHQQMKRLDKQLVLALHNNRDATVASLLKKGAHMWQHMRQLVAALDDIEASEMEAKQRLWDEKRVEVTRLRRKQARSGLEGAQVVAEDTKTIQASGITTRGPRQKQFEGHQALHEVSVGAKHALAVHQSGQLYGWGFGSYGRLASGTHEDKVIPQPLQHLRGMRFRSVACGYSHSLALRQDGQVFAWGSGATGKLGLAAPQGASAIRPHTTPAGHSRQTQPLRRADLEDCFTILPLPLHFPAKIRKIACGPSHSAAITTAGNLFVWGSGDGGRLGLGDGRFQDTDNELKGGNLGIVQVPTQVLALQSHHLVDVSCGTSHTGVLSAVSSDGVISHGGRAFVCGSAHALGVFCPEFTTPAALLDVQITAISCGNAHTAAVSIDGEVYTWGNNVGGCTGHDLRERFVPVPTRLPCLYQKPQNMARNRAHQVAALQSTVNAGYGAALALDGITEGATESTCSQTFREICPFWQVDLGVSCRIDTIRIWRRTGPEGDKLFPCVVCIGERPFVAESGKHTLAEAKAHSVFTKYKLEQATNPLVWVVPDNTVGQYVRVQIEGTAVLSLAQVEVFGIEEHKYQGPKAASVAAGDDILVVICRPPHLPSAIDKAYLRALCADPSFKSILSEFPTFAPCDRQDLRVNQCVLCTVQSTCPICALCKELETQDHDLPRDYRNQLSLDALGDYLLSLRPPKPMPPQFEAEEDRLARIYIDDDKPESALQRTEARVLAAVSKVMATGPKSPSFLKKAIESMSPSRLRTPFSGKRKVVDIHVRPQTTPSLPQLGL